MIAPDGHGPRGGTDPTAGNVTHGATDLDADGALRGATVPTVAGGTSGASNSTVAKRTPSVVDATNRSEASNTIDSASNRDSVRLTDVCVRDRVWWSDVDKMGVMYFARYVRFAEMAETEFFRSVGYSYDEIHAQYSIWLARIRLEIDYREPAKLDDQLVCRAELVKVGASSMHFRFPVERAIDGARLADISLVVACLDAVTLKTTRTPPALRERLRTYIVSQTASAIVR